MGVWTPGPGPTSGDDIYEGDDAYDIAYGGEGDDVLNGAGGSDFLGGEGGDDTLDGGDGDDVFHVAGFAISGVSFSYALTLGAGRDVVHLTSQPYLDELTITDFAPGVGGDVLDFVDHFSAVLRNWDGGSNPFATGHVRFFQLGADTLLQVDYDGGGDAWTTLATLSNVDAAALTDDNVADWAIDGSAPVGEVVTGGPGDDVLNGGAAADVIDGGAGDDRLRGDKGPDVLTGGAGADAFIYRSSDDAGATSGFRDQILDFARAEGDVIDLSAVDADPTSGGDQAFTVVGALTGAFGQLALSDLGLGVVLVELDVDGDGVADLAIEVAGQSDLAAGDFVL